jgi:copper chaperone CopZ
LKKGENIQTTISLLIYLVFIGCAGNRPVVEAEISVPTIQCGMCEHKIHAVLDDADGIKKVTIDPIHKTTTVHFDSTLIKLENIESLISQSGYQANDVKPDSVAYKKLELCCKIPPIKH